MSHECPHCGLTCRCNFDIDDICFGEPDHFCTHCDEDDEDFDDTYDDCSFCGAMQHQDHAIGCPNNHSPFNDLITKGYD